MSATLYDTTYHRFIFFFNSEIAVGQTLQETALNFLYTQKRQSAHGGDQTLSRMNESCLIMDGSCHIWMSNVSYE